MWARLMKPIPGARHLVRRSALIPYSIYGDGRQGGVLDDGQCSASRSLVRLAGHGRIPCQHRWLYVPGIFYLSSYVHLYASFDGTGRN